MNRRRWWMAILAGGGAACSRNRRPAEQPNRIVNGVAKVVKSEEEWRKILNSDEFAVARKKGTERAYTGRYWNNHEPGTYLCVCCGQPLFTSETKFESGTGWPSFTAPATPEAVADHADKSLFMERTEVLCSRCDAHLGHVFDDGPAPTGLRYCINSVSLKFDPAKT